MHVRAADLLCAELIHAEALLDAQSTKLSAVHSALGGHAHVSTATSAPAFSGQDPRLVIAVCQGVVLVLSAVLGRLLMLAA